MPQEDPQSDFTAKDAIDTKRAKRKTKRKTNRGAKRHKDTMKMKESTLKEIEYKSDATAATLVPFIKPIRRNTDAAMLLKRREPMRHDDAIISGYYRVGGEKSVVICFTAMRDDDKCDAGGAIKRDGQVVFMVKVTLFSDMSAARRDKLQWMLHHLAKDAKLRPKISVNGAQEGRCDASDATLSDADSFIGGVMKAMGWRAGFEKDVDAGTYAAKAAMRKAIRSDTNAASDYMRHVTSDAKRFHQLTSENFFAMSSAIFKERVLQVRKHQVPMFGTTAAELTMRSDTSDATEEITEHSMFSPHVIYTYGTCERRERRERCDMLIYYRWLH